MPSAAQCCGITRCTSRLSGVITETRHLNRLGQLSECPSLCRYNRDAASRPVRIQPARKATADAQPRLQKYTEQSTEGTASRGGSARKGARQCAWAGGSVLQRKDTKKTPMRLGWGERTGGWHPCRTPAAPSRCGATQWTGGMPSRRALWPAGCPPHTCSERARDRAITSSSWTSHVSLCHIARLFEELGDTQHQRLSLDVHGQSNYEQVRV